MKMLLLQMLVAMFAVVTLVWGLLCIKKWFAKIILVASSLFICLYGYISFLNYENTKSNIIECYKLNGCQNNFSADFIINYEKNILAKKIEDQIFAKTNTGNTSNTSTSTTDRPEIKREAIDQKPIEEIKMNEAKTDKEKLQSIKNR